MTKDSTDIVVQLRNLWLVGCHYRDLGFATAVLKEHSDNAGVLPTITRKMARVQYDATLESYSDPDKGVLVRLVLGVKPAIQPSFTIELDCVAEFTSASDAPIGDIIDAAERIAVPCLLAFAREKLGGLTHMTPYPTVYLQGLNLDALGDPVSGGIKRSKRGTATGQAGRSGRKKPKSPER